MCACVIDSTFILACYNRRHRRGGNSSTGNGQNGKGKPRRISQDSDYIDDDSLAAELLVSTVKNLKSLCEVMLDGVRYEIEKRYLVRNPYVISRLRVPI